MVNKRSLNILMTLLSVALPVQTLASDWGCQCLLCLADPRGATTESECKPPIKKLWRHLAKGKPFPTCEQAGDKGTRANISPAHYELCPKDYSTLGVNQFAFKDADYKPGGVGIPFYVGTGDSSSKQTEPKVCVSELLGSKDISIPQQNPNQFMGSDLGNQQTTMGMTINKNLNGFYSYRTVKAAVYRDIKVLPYQGMLIDVHIDGALYQRVPAGR